MTAAERALEAYPEKLTAGSAGGCAFTYDMNHELRCGYIKGYEQAKQDLALTWEDIRQIIALNIKVQTEWCGHEFNILGLCREVLKRFLEEKNKV